MYQQRVWTYGLFLIAWFCWYSLLIGANTDPVEVKALQAIKRNLIDPNKNMNNWNRGDPCISNWAGVVCFDTTLNDGYLHVNKLLLLNMNLSGSLSPELGRFSKLTILDFMWNNISGSIPKGIGNITSLRLLLLNGNQLTGSLPEELGYLPNLDRLQIDKNQISGSIPKSFAYLNATKHLHMNNNSISGHIPHELSRLPKLIHFLLDNNNLSGSLPSEFSKLPKLQILQLDNNNFEGSTIPASYGNMSNLLKMSLRNCNLTGPIPDLSQIPKLGYLDLSSNRLNGSIPSDKLSENITTIDLSNNKLTGTIPANFSDLPNLQKLLLSNNSLNGFIPSTIWQNRILKGLEKLTVDLQYNELSNITGSTTLPPNVTVWLQGNPLCLNSNPVQFCGSPSDSEDDSQSSTNSISSLACPPSFEFNPNSPEMFFCAAPLLVGYRLKSPGFSDFLPYRNTFMERLTDGLHLFHYQLELDSIAWQIGPRLRMYLKFFPDVNNTNLKFNTSEVQRIRNMFSEWKIPHSDLFGPYELLNFTLSDIYKNEVSTSTSGLSKGALAGIVVGAITGSVILSAVVSLLILRMRVRMRRYHPLSRRRRSSKASIKIDGVKGFTYGEMALATNNFNSSAQVGQGGYGKVYKGILADGTIVAIKRAQEGSLQGEKEFLTEIELLSRLHHRNLLSLIGYCDEEVEQMLVYEFMSNGTLRDHLSAETKEPLSLDMRLRIALGSAKGILYLHTEADPPIFHRDIKSSNILLDPWYKAKVADFGLSRLAPVPDIEGTVPGHVSTVVKGTPGYLDPEYFLTRQLTDKSDVYSLGVVFLELLTGMQPISRGKNIVREINVAYESGKIFSVIDEGMGSYPSVCVVKFVTLALKCCKEETDARPSMAEVVRELESIRLMMPDQSDTKTAHKMISDAGKVVTDPPPSSSSSSSTTKNAYLSLDVSGSNLVSGAIPSITPR